MIIHLAIRKGIRRRSFMVPAAAFFAFCNRAAHAGTVLASGNCSTSPDSLGCHLMALLNLLYVAAGVLCVVLVVVIVVAVRAYRKNSSDDEGEI